MIGRPKDLTFWSVRQTLLFLLVLPEVLLKFADPVQVCAHAIEHLAAFPEDLLNIRVCNGVFRLRR